MDLVNRTVDDEESIDLRGGPTAGWGKKNHNLSIEERTANIKRPKTSQGVRTSGTGI